MDETYFWEHVHGICSIRCMPQTALFQFMKHAGKAIDDEQKFVTTMLSIKLTTKELEKVKAQYFH